MGGTPKAVAAAGGRRCFVACSGGPVQGAGCSGRRSARQQPCPCGSACGAWPFTPGVPARSLHPIPPPAALAPWREDPLGGHPAIRTCALALSASRLSCPLRCTEVERLGPEPAPCGSWQSRRQPPRCATVLASAVPCRPTHCPSPCALLAVDPELFDLAVLAVDPALKHLALGRLGSARGGQ